MPRNPNALFRVQYRGLFGFWFIRLGNVATDRSDCNGCKICFCALQSEVGRSDLFMEQVIDYNVAIILANELYEGYIYRLCM